MPTQAQINDVFREFATGGLSAAQIQASADAFGVTPGQLATAQSVTSAYGGPDLGFGAPTPQKQAVQQQLPQLQGYTRSPYLDEMYKTIDAQAKQSWDQSIAPGIRYGQMAAGGFGDSRQGIAEGIAAGNLQTNVASQKAQAGQQDYQFNTAQNLQRYGLELNNALGNKQADNAYSLGLGNLGLGFYNAGNSYDLGMTNAINGFYTNQRGQDLQALALGSSLYGAGNAGYLGQGQGIEGIGNTQQQAAWTPVQNLSNLYSQYSGLGGQTVGTQTGSTLGNAAGGALAGAQLGRLWSGGNGYGTSVYNNPNNTGFGTGSQWGNQDYGSFF